MPDRQIPVPMPPGWTAVLDVREGYQGVSAEWRPPKTAHMQGVVTVTVRLRDGQDPAAAVRALLYEATRGRGAV